MTSNGNPQQALPHNIGHEMRPFEPQNLLHEMGNFFLPQSPNHNIEVLITPSLPNSSASKDGNTKIKTAHGVRDRRVRLSMGIAREFFDLQDMLGFDRASKTIGWLLARSKFAIQELALDKKSLGYKSQDGPSFNSSKEDIEKVSVEMRQDNVVVREKRVRARARARARTREKVSTIAKPVRFDHRVLGPIGKGDSTNLLADYNVITSQDSSTRLVGCSASDYLQDHPIAPIGDQNSSWASHFPNSYAGVNPEATISSVSGWNIFTSPTGYIS